jgi:RNA polymerase sigma-70 factor (ECF subfamily)
MHPPSATRASLLLRLRDAGDAQAWIEFDRRYGPLILGYCLAQGWQLSDAEDVRQLVMAKLAGSLRGFEYRPELGSFRGYLRAVVRGEMSRHASRHKARARAVPLDDGMSEPGLDPPQDAVWEQEWMRHHFRLAWESVRAQSDERTLEVFRHLLDGAPVAGVAQALGMTPAAVRKVKQRISERLRAAIAEQILDEEQGFQPEAE